MQNESEIKISVIMPSLNVAEFIDEAIKSVRQQTLKEIEILCIDAGSKDGTIEIIKKHRDEDPRVKYIPSDIKSYGHQLNLGMNISKGEFIGIVETDDYIEEKMYEALYVIAKKDDCEIVKADYAAFYTQTDGERFFLKRENFTDRDLYNTVLCPKRYEEVVLGDWYNWQGIYKKSFIKENEIFFSETPGAAFQDVGFMFYTLIYAQRVKYLRDSFYRYRVDRNDASSNSGMGVKYAYDEYKRIVDKAEKTGGLSCENEKVLYLRMAKSFLTSYGNLSEKSVSVKSDERAVCFEWFKDHITGAIQNEVIKENSKDKLFWKQLNMLLCSEERLKEFYSEREKYWKEILSKYDKKDIVIFGCGNYGYAVYKLLADIERTPKSFIDNNEALWGCRLEGIPIESPENYMGRTGDRVYIIANAVHYLAMKDQLLNFGIPEDEIIIFNLNYR